MTTYYWFFAIVELLLRRGSCALSYNQTTAVVLCDMITSLPKLKTLTVPWSCPDASATKSITWCTQRWTGINCNSKKLVISLTLGNQGLVGSIPRTIGLLTSLNRYFWINYNQISGTIPASFGNLTSLTSIRLDHNSLSGKVPRTLTKLSKLKTLNVNDNYLTGSLPTLSQVTYNDDEGSSVTTFTQLTHYPTSQPTSQPSGQPTSKPSKRKVLLISTKHRFLFVHSLFFSSLQRVVLLSNPRANHLVNRQHSQQDSQRVGRPHSLRANQQVDRRDLPGSPHPTLHLNPPLGIPRLHNQQANLHLNHHPVHRVRVPQL
jgi:Leucine rich repeat